ncbi:MAG: hypothetical protein HYR85_26905 [Planctomycetes bacterium]|nr:hypothetical protein [Planctomycetota bacterium]
MFGYSASERGQVAFRWHESTGMVDMRWPGFGNEIFGVTPDGSAATGSQHDDRGTRLVRWRGESDIEDLGELSAGRPGGCVSHISADGRTITGFALSAEGPHAFVWTEAARMSTLGDLDGGPVDSRAVSCSDDGAWIVGFGTSAIGREAVIWDSRRSLIRVADFLAAHGTRVPSGWTLQEATGIAIQGGVMTLAGTGSNPDGDREAWIAKAVLSDPSIDTRPR